MSPRRRLLLVVAALAAVLLSGFVFFVRSDVRLPGGGVSQDVAGPVLLVTGYGGGTTALDQLAADLRTQGRDATVVPPVGDGTGDLRVQAQALKTAADAAIAAGAPSVDVIGYSAGGVVVRLWADELGGASIARRIVTLGSPHHGADAAQLGAALLPGACPEACLELVPGNELLTGLAETPSGPAWISIWSTTDQVVTPSVSSRLAGAVNVPLQDVCPGVEIGHGQLPTDPLPVGIVELALDGDPLDAPPNASQCNALTAAGQAP